MGGGTLRSTRHLVQDRTREVTHLRRETATTGFQPAAPGLHGLGIGSFINGDQQILGLDVVSDDPDTQVSQVIGMMRRYVNEDYNTPQIRRAVLEARISGDPLYDTFRAVKHQMQFVSDESTVQPVQAESQLPVVEALTRPRDMALLRMKRGDCDDFCTYGAAMLTAQGVPCSFVTVAADPSMPDVWSHVYLAAYPDSGSYAGQRVPMDISHGPYVGWETPRVFKRQEWPVMAKLQLVSLGVLIYVGYLTWKLVENKR